MPDRVIQMRATLGLVAGLALTAAGIAQADIDSARQALSQRNYAQALDQLNTVLAQKPDDPEARFLKGLTLAREQQTSQAIALFEKLTHDYPDMAEAWNNLGVLYARRGRLESAKHALEKAVSIDAKYGPAQENLGDVYVALAQNAYDDAGQVEKDSSGVNAKSTQLADFLKQGTSLGAVAERSSGTAASRVATSASSSVATESKTTKPAKTASSTNSTAARALQASATKTPAAQPAPSQAPVDRSTPKATLQTWAAAWSAQDVSRYLSMYASDFKPDDDQTHKAWLAERRQRVSGPARIRVDISDIEVSQRGGQARVSFNQHYQSPTYQDREHKALLMTHTADGWQILREDQADKVHFTVSAAADTGAAKTSPES